jgi:hypothetical protein
MPNAASDAGNGNPPQVVLLKPPETNAIEFGTLARVTCEIAPRTGGALVVSSNAGLPHPEP